MKDILWLYAFILFFLMVPLQAAELSMQQYSILRKKRAVLRADLELTQAQLDKRSEDDIKRGEAALQKAADKMLIKLALSKEGELRREDIDFCFHYKPNVNVRKEMSPLMYAAENNTMMVHELIKAGADVNYVTSTTLGPRTTALIVAFNSKFFDNMIMLLQAGATMPCDQFYLSAGRIGLRMWRDPNILAHREKIIDAINDTRILPTQLSPIIVNYAFGESPKN